MRLLTCAAEPAALREGLRDLVVAGDGRTRRTWAVVGAVPGATREELMDLGRFVVRLDVGVLVAVGDAGPVHAGAVLEGSWGEESRHVALPEDAVALLEADLSDDDVVLVAGVPAVVSSLGGDA
jgi:UDP-N-acetylmuramoyl-tripeptide--D-alanyl-D-alanine ligase